MSLDGLKPRLTDLNTKIAKLDTAIAAAVASDVVEILHVRAMKADREAAWRDMQGLVSSAIGA